MKMFACFLNEHCEYLLHDEIIYRYANENDMRSTVTSGLSACCKCKSVLQEVMAMYFFQRSVHFGGAALGLVLHLP